MSYVTQQCELIHCHHERKMDGLEQYLKLLVTKTAMVHLIPFRDRSCRNSLKSSKYQTKPEYLDISKPKLTVYSLNLSLPWPITTATIHEPSNMAAKLSLTNGRKTLPPIVNLL